MKKENPADFLLIPLWLTDRIHLSSGPWRDIFSTIYNFSKDGTHTFRAPIPELAAKVHISERSASKIVNTLVKAGYITREQKKVISKTESQHAKFEYKANIPDLLARLEAGEEVWPEEPKKDEEISPIMEEKNSPIVEKKGEKISGKGVKIFPKKGEKFSGQYKDYNKDSVSIISLSARTDARAGEEREFFKIFFFNNAADPADEVRRFVGFYQSKGWEDSQGRRYDTSEKRAGLAYGWDFRSGTRLPKGDGTDRFLKFLYDVYVLAETREDSPLDGLLDLNSKYKESREGILRWICSTAVYRWVESVPQLIKPILQKHYGAGAKIYFTCYDGQPQL